MEKFVAGQLNAYGSERGQLTRWLHESVTTILEYGGPQNSHSLKNRSETTNMWAIFVTSAVNTNQVFFDWSTLCTSGATWIYRKIEPTMHNCAQCKLVSNFQLAATILGTYYIDDWASLRLSESTQKIRLTHGTLHKKTTLLCNHHWEFCLKSTALALHCRNSNKHVKGSLYLHQDNQLSH